MANAGEYVIADLEYLSVRETQGRAARGLDEKYLQPFHGGKLKGAQSEGLTRNICNLSTGGSLRTYYPRAWRKVVVLEIFPRGGKVATAKPLTNEGLGDFLFEKSQSQKAISPLISRQRRQFSPSRGNPRCAGDFAFQ